VRFHKGISIYYTIKVTKLKAKKEVIKKMKMSKRKKIRRKKKE